MYDVLIWVTGIVAFGSAFTGYRYSRGDTFYPLMFLGPMLAYPYFIYALSLNGKNVLARFLPLSQMSFVQGYYLLAIIALVCGVISAGRPKAGVLRIRKWHLSAGLRRRLKQGGLLLGMTGVLAYFYLIHNVGGFEAAYSHPHGGGWSNLGYVRSAKFWILPGLLFFMLSKLGQRWRWIDWAWIVVMAGPLIFHGIVGAWRGQTFAILSTLGLGFYMMRYRRPSLIMFFLAGLVLALLSLMLVVYRGAFSLGSDQHIEGTQKIEQFVSRNNTGNPYILGSGLIIDASNRDAYDWGGRYVLRILVRAIPSAIWHNEYKDVSTFLGVSGGYGGELPSLGWKETGGASVGLFADVWKQFSWGALLVLFLVGKAYGTAWRRSVEKGGLWIIVYILMVAFSLYLTQQTLQAVLWRVMLLSGVSWVVWRMLIRGAWRRANRRGASTRGIRARFQRDQREPELVP